MGIKGNLSTVNLAEVFTTLNRGNSTGLLRIQAPEGPRFVELQNGAISIAGRSAGRIMLGDLLISRGFIDEAHLEQALRKQKETSNLLGQVLIESGLITIEQLEEALRFQIEEEVCELFTLRGGDFDFLESANLDARLAPAGGMVRFNLDLNALLQEAARRADEWNAIEERIPSQAFLFDLTPDGKRIVKGGTELSPEGMVLLRLIVMHRTVEAMVQKACLGRFNTNRMLLELWDVGYIEPVALASYSPIAREHQRMNRYEEAERIVAFVVEHGEGDIQQEARTLQKDLEKARKPTISSAIAKVSADPKVRSEVIKRNNPGLILKKDRSSTPWVIMALLVLLAGAGAIYYLYVDKGKSAEYTRSRKELDELSNKARELVSEGKYSEGLQLFRDFKTFEPDVKKLADELFDRRQAEVESHLRAALEKFDQAFKTGKEDEWKPAAAVLEKFEGVPVTSMTIAEERKKADETLSKWRRNRKFAELDEKWKAVQAGGKKGELRLVAFQQLLTESNIEELNSKIRDEITRLRPERREAQALITQATAYRQSGDIESAKASFERAKQVWPDSVQAEDADKQLKELAGLLAAAQTEFEKIESLVTQNKSEEARVELTRMLKNQPPQSIYVRGLELLHSVSEIKEPEADALLKSALSEKDPAEARKKTLELIEKYPLSRGATQASFKINFNSQPEGAEVSLNGKVAGKTPLPLKIPALGPSVIRVKKNGYEPEEIIRNNLRDENLNVVLNKVPVLVRYMPVAACGGLALSGEQLVGASDSEALVMRKTDLQVLKQVPLRPPAANAGALVARYPQFSIWRGEALIPTNGKFVYRVPLGNDSPSTYALKQKAIGMPVFFDRKDVPANSFFAWATDDGYESYTTVGTAHCVLQFPADPNNTSGLATDGENVFLPRGTTVHAISGMGGEKKWEAEIKERIAGTISVSGATLAVNTNTGKTMSFDLGKKGESRWSWQSNSTFVLGPVAVAKGFIVLPDNGTVTMLNGESGAVVWTREIGGKNSLPPLAIRAAADPVVRLLAIATLQANAHTLVTLNAETGAVLWRTALNTAPLGMASDGDRLYVSTEDGDLSVFELKQ